VEVLWLLANLAPGFKTMAEHLHGEILRKYEKITRTFQPGFWPGLFTQAPAT
jgi:hypothetical protein